MSQANPIRLNAWILALEARGPAAVDPGPFIELVQRQLRSRRIHKPAWLGLVDHETWTQEALLDLCACLYESFLIGMLPTYVAEARLRDITGLVIKKIGWTFTDLQRKADPSGHAVFKNVEAACIAGIKKGSLELEGGRPHKESRPVNQSYLRSPGAPGPVLDLDREELRLRLAAQPGWSSLRQRMRSKSSKRSEEFGVLLERLLEGGPLRFRLGDLVDATKLECCPEYEQDRPIEEIADRGDAGAMADLRDYEGALRCEIDKEVSQPERRVRLQELVTHSLEIWPKTHALPDHETHKHRHGLSKTTAYEDMNILQRCLNRILTGDSWKNEF